MSGGLDSLGLWIDSGPGGQVVGSGAISPLGYADGETHHALVKWEEPGTTTTLYVDGAIVATGATGAFTGTVDTVIVGDMVGYGNPFNGTMSHVAFGAGPITDADVAFRAEAILGSYIDESSADRIARLAVFAGVADTDTDLIGSTPIADFDLTGSTALDAMRKVETTEGGVLFDALDGTLTFRGRDARYGAASEFTVSYTGLEVAGALRPVLDDQQQVNDMTATNVDGVPGRQFDQTSIDENGLYRDSLELMTTDPDEPLMRAGWVVGRYAEPPERISDLELLLDTASNTLAAGILGAEIGTKFTLTGLPANAPQSSMVLFVEGRAERISMSEDRVTFHTSPAALSDVWILDSASMSQLDSTTVLAY